MQEPTPFPMSVDSTMRSAFVSCPQSYYRTYFQHWKPITESVDLLAGGAFAGGIEVARKAFHALKKTTEESTALGCQEIIRLYGNFEPPHNHVKSLDRMVGALDEYFTQYGYATDHIQPLIQNGTPAVEFSFALPIPGTSHPDTGEPILYTGRYDMLGLYNDALFVIDEKTTKSLGATWFKNWTMRSQITGYCWAAKEFGYPVAGAIIRGISILKTKYGHAESIQYRPDWIIKRWLLQLARDVNRMTECWKTSTWDYSLDTACTNYGGCKLMEVCSSNTPDKLLEINFQRKVWDPLTRTETVLD